MSTTVEKQEQVQQEIQGPPDPLPQPKDPMQRHVLEGQQFSAEWLDKFFDEVEIIRRLARHAKAWMLLRSGFGRWAGKRLFKGRGHRSASDGMVRLVVFISRVMEVFEQPRLLLNLFYQPSTRTRFSFGVAARMLGWDDETTEDGEKFSSEKKGETTEDSIEVLNRYGGAGECEYLGTIVERHKVTGTARRAASVSDAPIVTGGDGPMQHPTQMLLDMFTIRHFRGRLDNLTILLGGDLPTSRTIRSLIYGLCKFRGNRIVLVSHPDLPLADDLKVHMRESCVEFVEYTSFEEALENEQPDVVYWTRLQVEFWKNQFGDTWEEKYRDAQAMYIVGLKQMAMMMKDCIIMHPLPHVGEIARAIYSDGRCKIFAQAEFGLYVRIALLLWTSRCLNIKADIQPWHRFSDKAAA